ncbi:MAG: M50 family metallopeptidase [Longimicrobiales bacterium]
MNQQTKRRLVFIAGFVFYFGALWAVWDTAFIYPLKIFVVLLHEISHAAVAVATGGTIQQIVLDPNQGGACFCPGGNAFLTLSAGYLGSLVWGGLMITAGQSSRISTRWVIGAIGVLVIGLTLAYVRGPFGIGFGMAFGSVLLLSAKKLTEVWNQRLLLVLGLTSALYAILDIKSDVLDRPELRSDAAMLGELTGISGVVWGFVWITIAILVSAWLLHRAYKKA